MYNKENLEQRLFELQDLDYREFHSKLMPGVEKEQIIGVRIPVLRKFAVQYGKESEAQDFLADLPHPYYEMNNLHMLLISKIKDYDLCLEKVEAFLPYIDNWATCDFPAPKCFEKKQEELLPKIRKWLQSEHTYTVRYAIGLLMRLYLDEKFEECYLYEVAQIKRDDYYINMMIAWYLATALTKQWDQTIKLLEERVLSDWVHRKTIQKAIESYRITKEQKEYLRSLRK